MRFGELLEKLADELNGIVCLLHPINEGGVTTSPQKTLQEYKQRRSRIEKLLKRECEGKPESFGVFDERVRLFFESFDQFSESPDDVLIWSVKSEVALIVDDIWEVYECLGNEQANYAAAAEHTQSFKDEWELLQAGAVALKEETSEWKRLIESDGFSVDGRTFQWCGKPYSLRESASRVVRVLHDAYLRGTQFIHEQYIKEEAEVQSDMRTLVRDNGLSKLIIPEIDSNGTRIKGKWGLIPRGK